MSREEENPNCESTHEVLITEMRHVLEQIKDIAKAEKENTVHRLKAEGREDLLKMLGITNVISIIGLLASLFLR